MEPKTKVNLFKNIFLLCLITYFCLCMVHIFMTPHLYPVKCVLHGLDIFENPMRNFIFLVLLFLFIAFVLTAVSNTFCCRFSSKKPRKVKIGERPVVPKIWTVC